MESNTEQSVKVYFVGEDKYSLINTIINPKVNFAGNLQTDEVGSIKTDRGLNVVIVSEETVSPDLDLSNFQQIIYYDRFMNNLIDIVDRIYHQDMANYDYNYLVNAMKSAKKSSTDSVFIGHSYALNGIDEIPNENVVNLSLSSQDLYYSFRIVKEIIDCNQSIKKCYIGTGYWSFYWDLSMAQNTRIKNIYYPIFNNSHNCKDLNIDDTNIKEKISLNMYLDLLSRSIFDAENLFNALSEIVYYRNKTYFNSLIKRETFSLIGNNKLLHMDEEIKYELGKERAEKHNKMIRYIRTRDENEKIMRELLKYLNEKNVQAIIVNFPTTKYYNKFLDKEFKQDYYKIFMNLEKQYKFLLIDLNNQNDLFCDEDYGDLDHISDSGAKKISYIINQKCK